MPAVSQAQFGFLGSFLANNNRKKAGLTKAKAREILRGTKVTGLPKFARSPVTSSLLESMEGKTPVSLKSEDGPFRPSFTVNLN